MQRRDRTFISFILTTVNNGPVRVERHVLWEKLEWEVSQVVRSVVKGRVGWYVAWTRVTDVEVVDGFWIYFEGFLIYGTGGEESGITSFFLLLLFIFGLCN